MVDSKQQISSPQDDVHMAAPVADNRQKNEAYKVPNVRRMSDGWRAVGGQRRQSSVNPGNSKQGIQGLQSISEDPVRQRSMSLSSGVFPPPGLSVRQPSIVESEVDFEQFSNPFSAPPAYLHTRRATTTTSGQADLKLSQMATQYFNQDPALHQRRHSIATAMAQQNVSGAQGRRGSDASVPENFVQDYGKLVDSTVSHMTPREVANSVNGLYQVEFKGGRSSVFWAPPQQAIYAVGDLVIVDADRGYDLGKITAVNAVETRSVTKNIDRMARADEVSKLLDKARDEDKALKVCQAKIKQKRYPMEIVDCEYQHDRKRLTFYYVSDQRIDFRDLLKDLFKIYKTRIWMCEMSKR